jgi:hypothetical protein
MQGWNADFLKGRNESSEQKLLIAQLLSGNLVGVDVYGTLPVSTPNHYASVISVTT